MLIDVHPWVSSNSLLLSSTVLSPSKASRLSASTATCPNAAFQERQNADCSSPTQSKHPGTQGLEKVCLTTKLGAYKDMSGGARWGVQESPHPDASPWHGER